MTDVAFYDDLFVLATELMNDFGTPGTIRHIVRPAPGADGKATETPTDYSGLAVRINNKELMDNMNLTGDILYAVKAPGPAEIGDHIIHAGVTFEIRSMRLVNPEGDRLMLGFFGVVRA